MLYFILLFCIELYFILLYCFVLNYIVLYCIGLFCFVLYCFVCYIYIYIYIYIYNILSHTLKNTANQRPGLPLHILRYETGSIPLYFPVIPYAQQFTWVHLRASQKRDPKPSNSCEPLRTFPITSGNRFRRFPNIYKDFRRFSENFKKS